MNTLKKIWWIFVIVVILTIIILDRSHKADMEYKYNSYRTEQKYQILKVDKLSSRTHENTEIFDSIRQTYRKQKDSLEHLKSISGNNKTRINDLNYQLNILDDRRDSIIKIRIKERKKFIKDIDSLKDVIQEKDNEILQLKEDINKLNKHIEN